MGENFREFHVFGIIHTHTHTYLAGTVEASAQSSEGGEKCRVVVALDGIEGLDGGQGSLPLSMEVNESTEINNVEWVILILQMHREGIEGEKKQ